MLLATLIGFLFVQFLIFKLRIFKWSSIPTWLISATFSIKFIIISTFIISLNYFPQFDLKGDHTHFLQDSEILADVAHQDPFEYLKLLTGLETNESVEAKYLKETSLWFTDYSTFNDSRTVIRAHSIISLLPFQNEYIHVLFVVLASTLSVLYFVETFRKRILHKKIFFIFISLGLPIFLIYGNMILKEPILILGLAMTCYGVSKRTIKSYHLWLGLLLMLLIKPYILFAFIISLYVYYLLIVKNPKTKIALSVIGFLFVIIGFSSSFGDQIARQITLKQYAFRNVGTQGLYLFDANQREHYYVLSIDDTSKFEELDNGRYKALENVQGSVIYDLSNPIPETATLSKDKIYDLSLIVKKNSNTYVEPLYIHNNKNHLITQMVPAIARGLFFPTITSPGSIAKIPAILETIFVMFLFFASMIYSLLKAKEKLYSPIIISLFVFILSTAYIVGITTPIIGAIVRYRIPTYLAIIIFSFIIIDLSWKGKQPLSQEQPQE